ncbi:MAG: hypothetical protein ABSF93_10860, partial [Candidatus Sulfotelmatobacter sp.]
EKLLARWQGSDVGASHKEPHDGGGMLKLDVVQLAHGYVPPTVRSFCTSVTTPGLVEFTPTR